MTGGAGHVKDMLNRIKQNNAMKTSNKPSFKSNTRKVQLEKDKTKPLVFKTISAEKLTQIKRTNKSAAAAERKREWIVVSSIVLFLLLVLILTLQHVL